MGGAPLIGPTVATSVTGVAGVVVNCIESFLLAEVTVRAGQNDGSGGSVHV